MERLQIKKRKNLPDILKLHSSMRIADGSGEEEVDASPAGSGGSVLGGEPERAAGTEAAGLILREEKKAVEIPGRGRAGKIRT